MTEKQATLSSQTKLYLNISKHTMLRLDELSELENIPKPKKKKKMINEYVPSNSKRKAGVLRSIYITEIKRVRKNNPYALFLNVTPNPHNGVAIALDYNTWLAHKGGKISWDNIKRSYVESLQKPEAIKKMEEIRKYLLSNDVYITSFERDEEHCMRKLFIDYMNGVLVWK